MTNFMFHSMKLLRLALILPIFVLTTLQTGCASGGFKLTRQYAGFVNRQDVIIRVVLYLLTGIVFFVTLLVDMVVFNTMDFWEGRVSANTYNFQDGDVKYVVTHSYKGPNKLRHSRIEIQRPGEAKPQVLELAEASSNQIRVLLNGELKATVDNIRELPRYVEFENGRVARTHYLNLGSSTQVAQN